MYIDKINKIEFYLFLVRFYKGGTVLPLPIFLGKEKFQPTFINDWSPYYILQIYAYTDICVYRNIYGQVNIW